MNIEKLAYNKQLKKLELEDIPFNQLPLYNIPKPSYQNQPSYIVVRWKNNNSIDKHEFIDLLLKHLSKTLNDTVLKLIIITPRHIGSPYNAFAFLASKQIVALHFEDSEHFKQWMEIIFEKFKGPQHDKVNGTLENQSEPISQFMLNITGSGHSISPVKAINDSEKPYKNTGKFIFKNVPQKYNEKEISDERQDFIKKYIDTSGAKLDLAEINSLFKTFIAIKGLKPTPPVDNEQTYQEFENTSGIPFPAELKALNDLHNGFEHDDEVKQEWFSFLSAEQVLKEWKNWKTVYDDWTLEDLTGNIDPDGEKTIGMYTNPYWIPFCSTGGGNFIGIDYAPGSQGKSGQLIAFGADEYKIRFIAEDLGDFLQQFIDGKDVLDNGFDD
ncbi:SMI1/KNR4 family protein [Galbibacter sp. EGI 63066]|uniref:SMI1/KNR4 family protein n=1 Tax=Galbibacter sp. EGI 63066 TaxID=2993559 RepID=UPI00224923C4|nr:SMI1/KNR4 family protein [Galbibacter sp. EGI 63066]MCX2679077.1 SMI1/KNR4 family protein [Galbibacter sp. EGI 63066]